MTLTLHPSHFAVNEAWIAFRVNQAPVRTERDGAFDCWALMDAASSFILAIQFVPAGQEGADLATVRGLLKRALSHKGVLPTTLFVSRDLPAAVLLREAARRKITTVSFADDQLAPFVDEAREGFRQRFESGPDDEGV